MESEYIRRRAQGALSDEQPLNRADEHERLMHALAQRQRDRSTDDTKDESEGKPEFDRGWRTITEEIGGQKSWPSFRAAKNELGTMPGTHLHHLVEQCQADPKRSGFEVQQINHSDNIARIPIEVHGEVTKRYQSRIAGAGTERLRDSLNGDSWEDQYETGCDILDEETRRHRGIDD